MNRALTLLTFLYLALFAGTGGLLVLSLNADEAAAPWIVWLLHNQSIVFGWHLVCWMVLGMFTNYYWDLFNAGKGAESVQLPRLLLPLMVSPTALQPVASL